MRALPVALMVLCLGLGPAQAAQVAADAATVLPAAEETPAQLRADELDRLFAELHRLTQAGTGAPIEAAIWKLWMSSDSPTAEVLLQQATAALEAGDDDPSLQLLDQLTQSYPDFAEAWNKRATLYYKLGRFDEALADIDRVLALEPRHFGALAGRGMILAQQRKYDAALAALHEALAVNPQMAEVQRAIKELERLQRAL